MFLLQAPVFQGFFFLLQPLTVLMKQTLGAGILLRMIMQYDTFGSVIMLSALMLCHFNQCHYAESRYAEHYLLGCVLFC